MIIGAANYVYWDYTKLFLSSLIKNGGIELDDLHYFIFDFAKNKRKYNLNCYYMMARILSIDRRINITVIPFKDMQEISDRFQSLYKSLNLSAVLKINLIDYLKGYLFKYIKRPYLYLDSDIFVKDKLRDLYKKCKNKNRLAMVVDRFFEFDNYFESYSNYSKKKLNSSYVNKGPLSSGVIFVPEDYTSLWFDVFSKTISAYGIRKDGNPGQCVWNILFWMNHGYYLPHKYYCLPSRKNSYKDAVLVHFPLSFKVQYRTTGTSPFRL